MEESGNSAELIAGDQDRRQDPRLPVDEAAELLLLNPGLRLPCRMVEISLTGCRMTMRDGFAGGAALRIEAAFKLRGFAFRFRGVTEWTDGKRLVGIRFVDVTARRRDELVEVLCEIAAENAARAVKQAAERLAAEEAARKQPEKMPSQPVAPWAPAAPPVEARKASPVLRAPEATRTLEVSTGKPAPLSPISTPTISAGPAAQEGAGPPAPAQSAPLPPAKPAGRERRTQLRHEVDTLATILLVNVASRIQGRILNLSVGGCRIRTEERFPVGIYTRVETEFHLEGLPFRLGGVVQAIQDRQHVGIRFLDMSERKREQVEQLIAEIEELRGREGHAGSSISSDRPASA